MLPLKVFSQWLNYLNLCSELAELQVGQCVGSSVPNYIRWQSREIRLSHVFFFYLAQVSNETELAEFNQLLLFPSTLATPSEQSQLADAFETRTVMQQMS